MQMKQILRAGLLALALAQQLASETLEAPVTSEPPVLAPASSSVGSTDILISVLAVLLVWAAVQQNERAKSG